jgi:hypothetical protein
MSALALLGGRNAKSKSSPLWPQFDEAERKALNQVLESRLWGRTPGPESSNSSRPLRVFMGRHGIAVTNGTAAFRLQLRTLHQSRFSGTGDFMTDSGPQNWRPGYALGNLTALPQRRRE